MNNKFSKVCVIFVRVARYSVIVPSYNQERFISETLNNLTELKKKAAEKNILIEIIVIDNCSTSPTSEIIQSYKENIDKLVIERDKGQYDAINKGIKLAEGDYWSWLNTDDLIDVDGFFKLDADLRKHPETEYIYGDVSYIDEHSKFHKAASTGELTYNKLLNINASISQPGSFFKTNFTKKIGELAPFNFAFDYEYILRCMRNKAIVHKIDANVAFFRYYTTSKSGSQDFRFLKEQLAINRQYGGTFFSKLSLMLRIRILKRKLFN